MTALLTPFSGFIPSTPFAHRIVGPATSMLTQEQRNASRDDELSFRHVVGRGAKPPRATALEWLERCHRLEALEAVENAVIVHSVVRGDFRATGFLADVSVEAYVDDRIKRHEATIAKTQRKMLRYMRSTRIFGNPVALAHQEDPAIAAALEAHCVDPPSSTFATIDGTQHRLWVVTGDDAGALCSLFDGSAYITDGHHRLAAAAALAKKEKMVNPRIPAGLFAADQLKLWAYARGLSEVGGDHQAHLRWLHDRFDLRPSDRPIPRPTAPRQFGVRVDRQSFVLTIPEDSVPDNPYDRLDVNLLQDMILEPLFGVSDPRSDPRLDFVADTSDDSHAPDDYDAWFLPYPTSVAEVMAVADAHQTMPPKSTFFLPKIPSGLVIRPID